jgi:hypothetical protein
VWRQIDVANSVAAQPVNLEEGIKRFIKFELNSVRQTKWLGIEDDGSDGFLPITVHFEPKIAIEKVLSFSTGVLIRIASASSADYFEQRRSPSVGRPRPGKALG